MTSQRSVLGTPTYGAARRSGLGVAFVLGSTFLSSTIGSVIRLVEDADGWQIIFYRNIAMFVAVIAILAFRYRHRFFWCFAAAGWKGPAGGAFMATATSLGVWAFLNTSVANVVFIGGTVPFMTGILAWLLLRERLSGATWIIMLAAFAGIAIMVGDGLARGRFAGDFMALATMLAFSSFVVVMRAGRAVDMMPVLAFGTGFAALIGAVATPRFAISAYDLGLCLLLGIGIALSAYILFTFGARLVRAGEVALLGTLEIILSPIWAWYLLSEVPAGASLAGGTVILLAVAGQAIMTMRTQASTT